MLKEYIKKISEYHDLAEQTVSRSVRFLSQ